MTGGQPCSGAFGAVRAKREISLRRPGRMRGIRDEAEESAMGALAIVVALVLGAASAIFYSAATSPARYGPGWELSLCSAAHTFCDHPAWPAIAAGVLLALVLIARLAAAARG
jgi:hypothetical protein